MKLSVVIPARDEEGSIEQTLGDVAGALTSEQIPYEIVVVDDGSSDETAARVRHAMECVLRRPAGEQRRTAWFRVGRARRTGAGFRRRHRGHDGRRLGQPR